MAAAALPLREPLRSDSYPIFREEPRRPDDAEIDQAINGTTPDLEKAKNWIYARYGHNTDANLQQMTRIVQRIVDLNRAGLSEADRKLRYTLEEANGLCCHMWTTAYNMPKLWTSLDHFVPVRRAMGSVAEAYIQLQNNYHQAVHTFTRLDIKTDHSLIKSTLQRWEKWIKDSCPAAEKERQEGWLRGSISRYNYSCWEAGVKDAL